MARARSRRREEGWAGRHRAARKPSTYSLTTRSDGSAVAAARHALRRRPANGRSRRARCKDYRRVGGWDPDGAPAARPKWLEEAEQPQEAREVCARTDARSSPWTARCTRSSASASTPRQGRGLPARIQGAARARCRTTRASANFGIARALNSLGDRAESRRHLLEALETAPHYRPAQDLLLELTGKPTP